jgi:hypothetical protein
MTDERIANLLEERHDTLTEQRPEVLLFTTWENVQNPTIVISEAVEIGAWIPDFVLPFTRDIIAFSV